MEKVFSKEKSTRRPKVSGEMTLQAPPGYWLISLALLIAVVSYWPTLHYGFIYDDFQQIVENPAIKSWRSIPRYFTAHVWASIFPGASGSYYRPCFLLWLRLNYVLFGTSPWGWHLASLLAHLATVWVGYLLMRRWTRDDILAGWGSLLFAVHPIHVEAVAWVSAVPEILFSLAGLGAIYSYIRYIDERRRILLPIALTLYGISLLTKETAVVIWPMIAACDWWLTHARRNHQLSALFASGKWQASFAAVTAAYLGLRLHALQGVAGAGLTHRAGDLLRIAPSLLWFYLSKLTVPFGLSLFYSEPDTVAFSSPQFYLPLLAVTAAIIGLFLWGRSSRGAAFSGFLLGLFIVPPLLGVFLFRPHDLVHDRYLYLPSAGACMLLAIALRSICDRVSQATFKTATLANAIVVVVAVGFAIAVRVEESTYRDNLSLFTRAVEVSPNSVIAWDFLASPAPTASATLLGRARR